MKLKRCTHEYREQLATRLATRAFRRANLSTLKVITWRGSVWCDSHIEARAHRVESALSRALLQSSAMKLRLDALHHLQSLPWSERRAIEWACAEVCPVESKAELMAAVKARRLHRQTVIQFRSGGRWYLPAHSDASELESACERIGRKVRATAEAALFGTHCRKRLQAPQPAASGWRSMFRDFAETGERVNALNAAVLGDAKLIFTITIKGGPGHVLELVEPLR